MDTKLRVRDNHITIAKELVVEERQRGEESILVDLDFRVPMSNRVKNTTNNTWGNSANVYMHIKNTNFVLMHIEKNHCVIIPRKITSKDGDCIDVVKRLKAHYFYINENDEVECEIKKKKNKLYRMICALGEYGNERYRLPEFLEVHHKWWRYISIPECMAIMTKKKHTELHKIISRKSHRKGKIIRNHEALIEFITELKAEKEFWKNREY